MILNEEVKYWNDLSLEFMTEESDNEDDPNCIIEHKLPWRSTGMSVYVILVPVYVFFLCVLVGIFVLRRFQIFHRNDPV